MEEETKLSSEKSDGSDARRRSLYYWVFIPLLLPLCLSACLLLLLRGQVKYYPPIIAAPGYELRLVTQPNPFQGALKQAAVELELHRCTYKLNGWQEERIYYTQTCGFGTTNKWVYHVSQNDSPEQIDDLPQNLSVDLLPVKSLREKIRIRDWNDLDSGNPLPNENEKGIRHLVARQDGLVAPDGKTIALVTKHVYGPEDVIVLLPTEP